MLTGLLLAVATTGPPLSVTARALMDVAGEQQRWSAFLGLRAPDAFLLDPDLQPAGLVLGRRPDPPQPRRWWPARVVTSCDGGLAFATGASGKAAPDGRYFTVWERQQDRSWRWVFDGLAEPEAAAPPAAATVTAACGPQPARAPDAAAEAAGTSGDGTLRWELVRDADRDRRRLVVRYATPAGWSVFEDATVR